MELDLENPLTSLEEHECDTTIPALFAEESDQMPSLLSFKASDFLVSIRRQAISLILQARSSFNFEPFICYLAVNYMDRFISKQQLPQGKPWIPRLLIISCISLAAKMKNADFSLSDLQREEDFVFDAQSIHRMEILILTTLNWQLRSITPYSFLKFFVSLCEFGDPPLMQALRDRASDIIFKAHCVINVLEYKPSLIAASALLCSSQELCPSQYTCLRTAISSCDYVNKEKLWKCLGVIQEMVMEGYESVIDAVTSSTKTPLSVLDRHCTNAESDNTTSDAFTPERERERENIKRRKSKKGADILCY